MKKDSLPVQPDAPTPTSAHSQEMAAAMQKLFLLQNIVASERECAGVAKFLRRLAPPLGESSPQELM